MEPDWDDIDDDFSHLLDKPTLPDAEYIREVFGPDGYLAREFEGYHPRRGQIDMAEKVHEAIVNKKHLFVEGPTGTGKSLAYAVPAIYNAQDQVNPITIATANIALQEQLVSKDLPLLQKILPVEFTFAMLKGRNNYLCLDQYEESYKEGTLNFGDDEEHQQINAISDWAEKTTTGDKSELDFEPRLDVWGKFSVSSEDCVGKKCKRYDQCFAMAAKERAQNVDVVVVNYHLLYAHYRVLMEIGEAVVLPMSNIVILDEAHKAADIARDFWGFKLTEFGIKKAVRRLGVNHPVAMQSIEASKLFFSYLGEYRDSEAYKTRLKETPPDAEQPGLVLRDLMETAGKTLASMSANHGEDSSEGEKLQRSAKKCREIAKSIESAMLMADRGSVYFIGKTMRGNATLESKLIDVGGALHNSLFALTESVIFTSATLATAGRFSFIAQELGAPRDEWSGFVAESPFDFEKQAMLIAVPDMPAPNDKEFSDAVAEIFEEIINTVGGRTLGLFTSYYNMNRTYDYLKKRKSPHRILRQKDMPRLKLLQEFAADTNSVLLGTESFWAGVDVSGESLSCVVMDKLPFPRRDDPILDALSERDNNWFAHYSLPRAVIAFKQGFGRLIRSTTDRGVVVILDNRIVKARYRGSFLNSLPPVRLSKKIESLGKFFGRGEQGEQGEQGKFFG